MQTFYLDGLVVAALITQLLQRSIRKNDSPTAFMMACGAGTPDKRLPSGRIIDFLQPNVTILLKQTNAQLARTMLLHGARVDPKDENGWMALHFAVANGSKDTIRQLLDYGADPNASAIGIGTAIEQDELDERSDLVALLRKYSKHP